MVARASLHTTPFGCFLLPVLPKGSPQYLPTTLHSNTAPGQASQIYRCSPVSLSLWVVADQLAPDAKGACKLTDEMIETELKCQSNTVSSGSRREQAPDFRLLAGMAANMRYSPGLSMPFSLHHHHLAPPAYISSSSRSWWAVTAEASRAALRCVYVLLATDLKKYRDRSRGGMRSYQKLRGSLNNSEA